MWAVQDLQLLLGAVPDLAKAFHALARRAQSKERRTFCQEGVAYTLRRVKRIRKALQSLDAVSAPRQSAGMSGLISDAKRAGRGRKFPATDAALFGGNRTDFSFRPCHLHNHRPAPKTGWRGRSAPHTHSVHKGEAGGHWGDESNGASKIIPASLMIQPRNVFGEHTGSAESLAAIAGGRAKFATVKAGRVLLKRIWNTPRPCPAKTNVRL
jgi:hypothetical protein